MSAAVALSMQFDYERAIPGKLMQAETIEEAAILFDTVGELEPAHFRHRATGQVFEIVGRLIQSGRLPDPVSVTAALRATGGKGNAGAYVASLLDAVPRGKLHTLAPWAQLVRESASVADADGAEREPDAGDAARAFAPVSIAKLYDETAEAIRWLWLGFLPVGTLVVLAAFMKAGKTTLAYAIIAALLRGVPFLGRETTRTKVLLLALEENRCDVKRRLRRFGVERDAALFAQFRPVPTAPAEWTALVEFVRREGIGLVVIDTLARCWPVWGVNDENDNARVAAALSPLLDLCRDLDVTVLVLHHTGKMAEGFGREVRGAGAILALCDQALLFDRYKAGDPCDRIIRVLGRYDESPAETVIRYDRGAGTYEVVGEESIDEDARGVERLFPQILALLRRKGATGTTTREVRSNVHGRGTTKDAALGRLVDQGKAVLRDGRYYHEDHASDGGEATS
jgi:hypothetical protein